MPAKEEDLKKLIPEGAPSTTTQHLPREKLPKDLQQLVDKDDGFFDELYDGQYEDTGRVEQVQCLT